MMASLSQSDDGTLHHYPVRVGPLTTPLAMILSHPHTTYKPFEHLCHIHGISSPFYCNSMVHHLSLSSPRRTGTKTRNRSVGYPSYADRILESLSLESKLCINHAHTNEEDTFGFQDFLRSRSNMAQLSEELLLHD